MTIQHQQKVEQLSGQIRNFYERKKPFRVFHGTTNSVKLLDFRRDGAVDISELNSILEIDTKKMTIRLEPNVSMDKLVRATLAKELLPPVVMEFPGITVGGAIQGNGGESSSFKWGAFNQTALEHEIIAGDGSIYTTSADQNSDIFYGVPGTAGTIGILTAATLRLIEAKKYVTLDYIVVRNFSEAEKIIRSAQLDKTADFIDGIMFASDLGVIVIGRLSNKIQGKKVRFSRSIDQWYYLHVEETLTGNPAGWTETVPIKDYLFRYDRGAFWVGTFAFEMFNVPFNRFTRWLLNPILHTRKLYEALQDSGQSQRNIVQDIVLPMDRFVPFCEYIDRDFGIYPLWLCPMKVDNQVPFQLNNLAAKTAINIGIWGREIRDYDEFVKATHAIEKATLKNNGRKWTYAFSYFTEKEFWHEYDEKKYNQLRHKYHSDNLPTMYDKSKPSAYMPVQKRKAVIKTIFGLAGLKLK